MKTNVERLLLMALLAAACGCSEAAENPKIEIRLSHEQGDEVRALESGKDHNLRIWLQGSESIAWDDLLVEWESSECLSTKETSWALKHEGLHVHQSGQRYVPLTLNVPLKCQGGQSQGLEVHVTGWRGQQRLEFRWSRQISILQNNEGSAIEVRKQWISGQPRSHVLPGEEIYLELELYFESSETWPSLSWQLHQDTATLGLSSSSFEYANLVDRSLNDGDVLLLSDIGPIQVSKDLVPGQEFELQWAWAPSAEAPASLISTHLEVAHPPQLSIEALRYVDASDSEQGQVVELSLAIRNPNRFAFGSGRLTLVNASGLEVDPKHNQVVHGDLTAGYRQSLHHGPLLLYSGRQGPLKEVELTFEWQSTDGYRLPLEMKESIGEQP